MYYSFDVSSIYLFIYLFTYVHLTTLLVAQTMVYSVKVGTRDEFLVRITDVTNSSANTAKAATSNAPKSQPRGDLSMGFSKTCIKHTSV
jgi:hypothetical protein